MNKGNVLIGVAVAVMVVFGFIVYILGGIHLSQLGVGEHSGYITAIDQRGYIWRNYDVYFKTDNSSSQEDLYCIFRDDKGLIEKATEANQARKQVTITYKGVRAFGWGLCGTTQITGIK